MSHIDQYPEKVSVTQSNVLIEASLKLTLLQKRFANLLISKINPLLDIHTNNTIVISANEWLDHYDDDHPWQSLKRATEDIQKTSIELHARENMNGVLMWLDLVFYDESTASVLIRIHTDALPLFTNLKNNFTSIPLTEYLRLSSAHSMFLLEYLKQYSTTGFRRTTISDLRFALGLKNKYKQNSDFVKKVIDPAVNDIINANPGTRIDYDLTKKNKQITEITFYFNESSHNNPTASPQTIPQPQPEQLI